MNTLAKAINRDFITAYQSLDDALRHLGYRDGIATYLSVMDACTPGEKRSLPAFSDEIVTLRSLRFLYHRLQRTADVNEPLASEDDVDYLRHFLLRLESETDPINVLKSRRSEETENNPDAVRARPIESTAIEISSRPTFFKEGTKKRLLKAATLLALSLAVILKIKRGFIR